MNVIINDELSLEKIAKSGQAFRIKRFDDDTYRFVTKSNILYIKDITSQASAGEPAPAPHVLEASAVESTPMRRPLGISAGEACMTAQASSDRPYHIFSISCSQEEWNIIWRDYFDLDNDYYGTRCSLGIKDEFMDIAIEYGRGIRMLRQDPFEMLISFIISQRKSIPAISGCIEKLCNMFGEKIETEHESLCLFPKPAVLRKASVEDLRACGLGYRDKYVLDAAAKVSDGILDLDSLYEMTDTGLIEALKMVNGVGDKVASCIGLFAYERLSMAPIDVWIRRIMDNHYDGKNPFLKYKKNAGIVQQYAFYYAQMNKDKI